MEAFERELLAATAEKRLPGTVVAAANREGIFTFGVMALRWVFLFCFLFTLLLCIPYCQYKIKSLKFTESLNRYIHLHQTLRQHQSPPRRPARHRSINILSRFSHQTCDFRGCHAVR